MTSHPSFVCMRRGVDAIAQVAMGSVDADVGVGVAILGLDSISLRCAGCQGHDGRNRGPAGSEAVSLCRLAAMLQQMEMQVQVRCW